MKNLSLGNHNGYNLSGIYYLLGTVHQQFDFLLTARGELDNIIATMFQMRKLRLRGVKSFACQFHGWIHF